MWIWKLLQLLYWLDYGELNGSLQEFLREFGMPSGDIDDEVLAEKNGGVQIITDRRKSCPKFLWGIRKQYYDNGYAAIVSLVQ